MEYHKIQSIFKRDQSTKKNEFIMWNYSLPEFKYLESCTWRGTEKVDGTNIRIYKTGEIGGRTKNAQIPAFLLPKLEHVRNLLVSSDLPDDTILYGEGYGAKIQSGGHYLPDGNSFCLFDVSIAGNFQECDNVFDIGDKLGISVAPILGMHTLRDWVYMIKDGEYKESKLHIGARNEGVVLRPTTELRNRCGHRVITKLKFKDFS